MSDLRERLAEALAWMGPDYRQAVDNVMDVLGDEGMSE